MRHEVTFQPWHDLQESTVDGAVYVRVHREIQSKLGVLELENRDLWPNIETNLKQVAHASFDIEPSVGCQREFPSRITAVLDG
jgi:hypothetical protein